MADAITLTAQPVRVTAAGTTQPLWVSREILDYDILDFDVRAYFQGGTAPSVSVQINIITSLYSQIEETWVSAGNIVLTSATPRGRIHIAGNLLRYVRWQVSTSNWGDQTAATFWIRGMARQKSEP